MNAPDEPRRERPLRIGLSARLMHRPPPELGFRGKVLQYLEQSAAHLIMRRGALVFMIPTIESHAGIERASVSMRDYVSELDGLVLQGGSDVSPECYGQKPMSPDWSGDPVRDRYEIELLWEFVFQEKPVLGICRGAQLINVAFGGTLIQDIPSQVPNAIRHHDSEAYDTLSHRVSFEPRTLLERLYPAKTEAQVISIHHQAIDTVGNGLVVEARSVPDGLIEAVRRTGSNFVVGLQWHPEFHLPRTEAALPGGSPVPERNELLDSGPILQEFLRCSAERRGGSSPLAASGASLSAVRG